jgi:hypothetical protein
MFKARVCAGVWPPTATEALQALEGTRWANFLDMDYALKSYEGLDLMSIPTVGISPEEVDRAVAEVPKRLLP